MKAQFKFLSGARAGGVEAFGKAYIGLGRHPLSDVRFDAERDLDVSSRHAAITRHGDGFVLKDLGSKNGTLLNGKKITAEVPLKDGDVIGFGDNGPSVEFHIIGSTGEEAIPAEALAAAQRQSQPKQVMAAVTGGGSGGHQRSSTAVRIAIEVARQTKSLRRTTKVLLVALFVVVLGFGVFQWRTGAAQAEQLEAFRRQADSVLETAQRNEKQLRDQIESVKSAYDSEVARVRQLQTALQSSGGDPQAVDRLRDQLADAQRRLTGITQAAAVDYRAISQKNRDAIAIVIVEFSPSERFSGTAFAIDSQGTLVTNKHVLTGDEGDRTPQRIAVKFSGSKQWFAGHMVAVSNETDLGVLKVDIRGGTPKVVGIAHDHDAVQVGDPVAIIGFPLGLDLPMEGQGVDVVADPTLTTGTVSKLITSVVQLDAYGAPGSSGSPIFDRDGRVVAVLYGGQRESNGKIIFSVPANLLTDFLRSQNLLK